MPPPSSRSQQARRSRGGGGRGDRRPGARRATGATGTPAPPPPPPAPPPPVTAGPGSPVAVVAGLGAAVGLVALVVVGAALALLASPLVGVLVGLLVAAAAGAAVATRAWRGASPAVLALAGGAPPDPAQIGPARLANVVASVAVAVGIPEPALRVVDDPAPNALVTGPDARRATLVVTSGLLERLDALALEAVVAHQLAVVRAGATHGRDVAVSVLGRAGRRVPALAARGRAMAAIGPEADLAAVFATRYPPGMLRALEAVAAGPEVAGDGLLAPLWFAPPGAAADLALRLEVLRELS